MSFDFQVFIISRIYFFFFPRLIKGKISCIDPLILQIKGSGLMSSCSYSNVKRQLSLRITYVNSNHLLFLLPGLFGYHLVKEIKTEQQ